MTQSRLTPLPIILRRLVVESNELVNPRLRRVRLGGEELGAFERDGVLFPAFASPGFDDHVKLIFAPGGDIADALPVQRAHGIEWTASPVRESRDYTPVEVDADAGTIAFDFVVHSDSGDRSAAGPAEAWAAAARPGDDLWIVGPKSSTVVPPNATWTLMVADETGLPAVRRFLTERPVPGPVRAVLAVADPVAQQVLPVGPDDEITWVCAEPGDGAALADAVAGIVPLDGAPYIWGAGESRSLLPIRKYVKRELAVPKRDVDITGYWHLRELVPEQAAADDGAPTAGPAVVESPVTWFAIRAALRLGLIEAVDAGRIGRAGLARRLGIPDERLAPLVELLIACRVLSADGTALTVGERGDVLLTDDHAREQFDGVRAEQILALTELAECLPAAEPAWRRRTGTSFARFAASDAAVYAELIEDAERLQFLIPALAALSALWTGSPVFFGPGAVTLAQGLRTAGAIGPGAVPTVVAQGAPRAALEEAAGAGEILFTDDWPRAQTAIAACALAHCEDEEAVALLAAPRPAVRRLVIVESTSPDALSPRVAEDAVLSLALVGRAPRDREQLGRLARDAGWRVVDEAALGWGVSALVCEPAE
ncbi:hypothetical protein ACN95_14130 [Gordonia sihwensis]|uniref:siderophore-interacting protein n=1 Tax=Gordonia sihwensis TaxID=173559 RepID=UPI001C9303F8|nr:siderophore-interacting protein [Gordonia sihwensis]MBY4571156.1 hypothetical protein [Gordonia sihwensis]